MDFKSKIIKTKYIHQLQDPECYPEKSSEDSLQTTIIDSKITSSTLSPNKSRRSIQKKVIIVPINDGDCSRVKGDMSAPPSDSWAWRKYGQKPIKGSPFPRGYYKCSSSKGCPARKQVEKSREDPNMLVLVYYSDHNHPCPPPRKSNNQNKLCKDDDEEQDEDFQKPTNHIIQSDHNIDDTNFTFTGMAASEGPFITSARANDHGSCFSDYDDGVYSTTMLDQVPFFTFDEMTTMYTIRHEDEAIFADLDELPECSTVFHRRKMEIDEERRRQNLII